MKTLALVFLVVVVAAVASRGQRTDAAPDGSIRERLLEIDERIDDIEARLEAVEARPPGTATRRVTAATAEAFFASLRSPMDLEAPKGDELVGLLMRWKERYAEAEGDKGTIAAIRHAMPDAGPELTREPLGILARSITRCLAAEKEYREAGGK